MSRIRLAIVAGVMALLASIGLGAAARLVQPIALVLPLVDVEIWPMPIGLHVRVLEYGEPLATLTLPLWPLVVFLVGVGLAAVWGPRRSV